MRTVSDYLLVFQVTTGGTESIIMACKAFRDFAYSKGISNPQIIVPSTIHSAFDKAAQYLGLSVKTIPVNPKTMTVNVEAVKKAIGRRTCLVSRLLNIFFVNNKNIFIYYSWILK